MSQNAFELGQMWNTYLEMEKQFTDYLDYVPLTTDHKKVYSGKLLRLMLQIGGYIDTAFKEMAFYHKFNGNINCEKIRRKVTKNRIISIDFSLQTFEPLYGLSRKSVLVKSLEHFTYRPLITDRFSPFAEYRELKTPKWWSAYNAVKHNMLKNIRKANLENTMTALGAAFLLNAIHEPSLMGLAKSGVANFFDTSKREIFHVKEELIERAITGELHVKKGLLIRVETKLFLIAFRLH